tara:strand:- start:65 stop:265 length:201 start_codon:yes stop_codon:yes gene_type:complete
MRTLNPHTPEWEIVKKIQNKVKFSLVTPKYSVIGSIRVLNVGGCGILSLPGLILNKERFPKLEEEE